jgi:Ser/Thr protein kinase RdoA (MazF antagonist)
MTQELIQERQLPDLPVSIRTAYDISEDAVIEPLSGGLVNDTVLVHDRGEQTIMRRLSDVLDSTLLEDGRIISEHLAQYGWEAPKNMPTVTGDMYQRDESGLVWHRMELIDSDGQTPGVLDNDLSEAAGAMIGSWHNTMRSLDYQPRFGIDHFHDTRWQAHKLAGQIALLPDSQSRGLATDILKSYVSMPAQAEEPVQIIHGDPKLDNMLFRDGRPFTLIDFDTVMLDSPWTDVGDFLRSLTGKLLHKASPEPAIQAFVESYHEANQLRLSAEEATHQALLATGRIALELGMRYLSDIVDPHKYFSWDQERHSSRRDNHFERAKLQLAVADYALEATAV